MVYMEYLRTHSNVKLNCILFKIFLFRAIFFVAFLNFSVVTVSNAMTKMKNFHVQYEKGIKGEKQVTIPKIKEIRGTFSSLCVQSS